MLYDGLAKVTEGITTMEEVMRVAWAVNDGREEPPREHEQGG